MAEKKYRVYRYQNLVVLTASYIGKTYCKYQSMRAGKDGCNYKVCPKFWNGIQTYGWPNFQYSVLADNLTKEEAERLEQYYIEYYDSVNQGYNISLGGSGPFGVPCSESKRKKLSDVLKGRYFSDETKKKLAISHGVNGVLQYTMDGEFIKEYPSIAEASRRTGVAGSNISNCCNGLPHYNSAGGSIWKFCIKKNP